MRGRGGWGDVRRVRAWGARLRCGVPGAADAAGWGFCRARRVVGCFWGGVKGMVGVIVRGCGCAGVGVLVGVGVGWRCGGKGGAGGVGTWVRGWARGVVGRGRGRGEKGGEGGWLVVGAGAGDGLGWAGWVGGFGGREGGFGGEGRGLNWCRWDMRALRRVEWMVQ